MTDPNSQISDTIVVEDPTRDDTVQPVIGGEDPILCDSTIIEPDATFFEIPRTTLCPVIRDARIFVIDDEPAVVELIVAFLTDEGHNNVIGITEPASAMDQIRFGHPDAVILDLQMPGIHGLEILREIREDVKLGPIPVLFLTADADHELKRAAFELGAADFLTKPIDYTELSARVRNTLVVRSHHSNTERNLSSSQPRFCVSSIGDILVNVAAADGTDTSASTGQLYDLSRSGARISLERQLKADEPISLQVLAPKVGVDFQMTAVIRWSQPSGTSQWYHGCSFSVDLPDDILEKLVSTGQLDRRRDERTRISLEAHVRQELESAATTSVLIEDYSFSGLRLFSPQLMKLGERLMVELYSEEHDPVRIPVRPHWQHAVSDGFSIGCSFLSHTAFRQIQQFTDPDEQAIREKLDQVIEHRPHFGASTLTWVSLLISFMFGAFGASVLPSLFEYFGWKN